MQIVFKNFDSTCEFSRQEGAMPGMQGRNRVRSFRVAIAEGNAYPFKYYHPMQIV